MPTTDREQVLRVLEGDKEAFGALVDTYQGMVFAVALNVTGNYADSQDILQESFIRAYQKLGSLSDPTKFSSWLYVIAKRVAVGFLRKQRRVPLNTMEADCVDVADPDAESPAEAYARKQLSELLWRQVGQLPPKTREAVLLYYMEGFSVLRASEFLGISEDAMKQRLSYGREKLRENVTEMIEDQLHKNGPSSKTRRAIVAALPAMGTGKAGLLGSGAAKGILALFSLSAKQILTVAILLVAAIAGTLWIQQPTSPTFLSPSAPTGLDRPGERAVEQEGDKEDSPTPRLTRNITSENLTPPLVAPPTYAIRGEVIEKGVGSPVNGVEVVLNPLGTEKRDSDGTDVAGVPQRTLTDSHGQFEFQDIAEGNYEVSLNPSDPSPLEQYALPMNRGEIRLRVADHDIDDLTFELLRGSYISGVVVDRDDGNPIEGAQIRLFSVLGNVASAETSSDADGRFVLSGIFPSVNFRLFCSAPGYEPFRRERLHVGFHEPVEGLALQMEKGTGATVSGQVVNRNDEPVESAVVSISHMDTSDPTLHTSTDAIGEFLFRDLSPGQVRIAMESYSNVDTRFRLAPREVRDNMNLVVDQEIRPGFVSGCIVNENIDPISVGTVFAVVDSRRMGMSHPDDEGMFRIANLAEDQPVDICYRGQMGREQPTDASDIPVPTEDLVVIFTRPGQTNQTLTLRGEVTDAATNKPVTRFAVNGTSFFDPDGLFTLPQVTLNQGSVSIQVQADGYIREDVRVQCDERATEAWANIGLSLGTTIEGRVVNQEGAPVEGALVYLGGHKQDYVWTEADGSFRLEGIGGERCRLRVSHPAYALFTSQPMQVDADTAIRDYEIRLGSGGSIAGIVWDREGNDVSDAMVKIEDAEEKIGNRYIEASFYPRTDENGAYAAILVPPGRYEVDVDELDYGTETVEVEEGGEYWVDFGLRGASVLGTVYRGGSPVPNVTVRIGDSPEVWDDISYKSDSATNADGGYALHDIPAGRYYLKVLKGSRNLLLSEAVDIADDTRLLRDLRIPPGATLSGTVVNGVDDSPVPQAAVYLRAKALSPAGGYSVPDVWDHATTGLDGSFSLHGIKPDTYILQAKLKTLGEAHAEITLGPGQVLDGYEIAFNTAQELEIHTIVGAEGEEIPLRGNVFLWNEEGHFTWRRLNEFTPSAVVGLSPGVYSISARLEDRQGVPFVAPIQTGIAIEGERGGKAVLAVSPSMYFRAELVNAQEEPATGLHASLYAPNGLLVPLNNDDTNMPLFRVRGNTIRAYVPEGEIRIVLARSGTTVFDDFVAILPQPGDLEFTTTLIVDR